LLVLPRHAPAKDSSGQASCPPGFGSGQGCFGRVRAPAVTGLHVKSGCLARSGALLSGARGRSGFGVSRRGFRSAPEAGRRRGTVGGIFRQGRSPLITRQRSNSKQRCSPAGCGVSSAQQCVQLTSLRSRVRRRDFQIQVVVPAKVIGRCRSATNAHVGRHRHFSWWNIHNSGQRHGLKAPPSARRLPPAAESASGGLFHRGVFAVGLFCPPSRPLIRLAGSVCNGMLPAVDASGPRRPLIRAFSSRAVRRQRAFPVRRLARRGSGTVRGVLAVSVRQRAGAGLRGKPKCLARRHARSSGWHSALAVRCCQPWTLPARAVRSPALFHPAPCVGRELFRSSALPAGVLVRSGMFWPGSCANRRGRACVKNRGDLPAMECLR